MARKTNSRKATSKKASPLSARNLVMIETVLLVGLAKEMLEWVVLERLPLPPSMRVVLGMIVVAGTLGGLLVLMERRLRKRLDKAHRTVQRRYRLPALVEHAAMLVWIFLAYAAFWNQETGALSAIWANTKGVWNMLSQWVYG